MNTIAETRRIRLDMLVKRHDDSLAKLNEALGLDRTDSTLSQIRTQAKHSKTGKPRSMGDDLARRIEDTLLLERGWMDTPPTLSEQYGHDDSRVMIEHMVQQMPPEDWPTAVRLLSALKRPEAAPSTQASTLPPPQHSPDLPLATLANANRPKPFVYKKVNQIFKQPKQKRA